MSRDHMLWIYDIQEAINDIMIFIEGYDMLAYLNDPKTTEAVERKLSIIGEASAQLPENFKSQYNEVPWTLIKGFRNILIHEYFGIDQTIVWNIIEKQLPVLKLQIDSIIDQNE